MLILLVLATRESKNHGFKSNLVDQLVKIVLGFNSFAQNHVNYGRHGREKAQEVMCQRTEAWCMCGKNS